MLNKMNHNNKKKIFLTKGVNLWCQKSNTHI